MHAFEPELKIQNLQIGAAVIIGVAVIGFFAGTSEAPRGSALHPPPANAVPANLEAARSYAELRETPRGEITWDATAQRFAGPGLLDEVQLEGTSKADDLADRADRRAYDGAPPTIPHPIRQSSAAECLACHADGLQIRGKLASAVSHDEYASCTQCHVVEDAPMPGEMLAPDATFAVNGFVGLPSADGGDRAWGGAPPVVPHPTEMRERCDSCHGAFGRAALRSSHPERQSCSQCHASSAALDRLPWATGGSQ